MEYETIVTGGDFNFILRHWDAINFSIIGLAIIAIAITILSKDRIIIKIVNIFAVSKLPLIGVLYVFGWELYKKSKRKRESLQVA